MLDVHLYGCRAVSDVVPVSAVEKGVCLQLINTVTKAIATIANQSVYSKVGKQGHMTQEKGHMIGENGDMT